MINFKILLAELFKKFEFLEKLWNNNFQIPKIPFTKNLSEFSVDVC